MDSGDSILSEMGNISTLGCYAGDKLVAHAMEEEKHGE